MKKKILIGLASLGLVGVALFQVVPALAQTPNPLDHVVISPTSTTLPVGGQQQFTAVAQDSSDQTVTNVTYSWMVTAGGGSIIQTGTSATVFTAGGSQGTFTNTVQVVVVQNNITRVALATVTVTGTPGAVDHVVVTPANVTLVPGGVQQFTAQAYDLNNIPISGVNYSWATVAAAGTLSNQNINVITFTAGANTGTFAGAISATSVSPAVVKTGTASITIATQAPATPAIPSFDSGKLVKMFSGLLNKVGFGNFLGGTWQVKNGTSVDTIKAIPGVVQGTPSSTSLTVLPNGQTTNATFTLSGTTVIMPKGTTLAANQKVVVITVNDVPQVVAVINPVTTGPMPPGLKKQDEDKREGKQTPPGWSHGKKMGWGSNNGNQGDSEGD